MQGLQYGKRANLFEANISANKISLSQGQSHTERKANFVSRIILASSNIPGFLKTGLLKHVSLSRRLVILCPFLTAKVKSQFKKEFLKTRASI